MTLLGAPQPPRSCLDRARSATDPAVIDAMRRQAWHQHGVAALNISEITDPWLRQAVANEAAHRWSARSGATTYGR
jgi:hypothetical protein